MGKPRKVDSPKKKKVEKPQDGRQKSGQNIGNPYQMEDNKNPKGAAPKAPPCCLPFGVFVSFPDPILGRFRLFLVLFSGKGFSSILGAPNKRFFTKTSQEVRTSFFNIWRFELPLTEIRRFEVEPRIPFWRFRFMSTKLKL